MNIQEIIVPAGIRYISDWSEMSDGYNLANFPFPHILDKKIPGCGFTEYCLRNELDIILCAPRLALLENKLAQHQEDVFYFKNDFESDLNVDKDLSGNDKLKNSSSSSGTDVDEETESEIIALQEKDPNYTRAKAEWLIKKTAELEGYTLNRQLTRRPVKILVTYDSFGILKDRLQRILGSIDRFFIVVDEFQSIFTDSAFKSSTELEFLNHLQGINQLCYVSATPMISSYLAQLKEFQGLPYFAFDWTTADPGRLVKPVLSVKVVSSLVTYARRIISNYKIGDFERYPLKKEDGSVEIIESREAVFYVNSINNIISIIKGSGLKPDECNILCARSKGNAKRLKKRLGKSWEIGTIPLKGSDHKMFTFCTRTVYLGADFYSTNAKTFVFSDANIDSLAVDITLDLPQILGRQRLEENPWRNQASVFVRTATRGVGAATKEDFDSIIAKKVKRTNTVLDAVNKLSDGDERHEMTFTCKKLNESVNYKYDYVAANCHAGSDLVPVFNHLVMVAEQRAFDIQQIDYKDRFSVFNSMRQSGFEVTTANVISGHFSGLLSHFDELIQFTDKMKLLCELSPEELSVILPNVPLEYRKFIEALGTRKILNLRCRKDQLEKAFNDLILGTGDDLENAIYSRFKEGDKIFRSEVKEILGEIYTALGKNAAPKASDLENYFDISLTKMKDSSGKRSTVMIIGKKK